MIEHDSFKCGLIYLTIYTQYKRLIIFKGCCFNKYKLFILWILFLSIFYLSM